MRLVTAVLLSVALVAGCSNDRAEKTARIRNLSASELAEIHASLDELKRTGAPMNLRSEQVPPAVARLQPDGVMFRGDSAWIHVAGHVDDKVYLFVNGLGESQSEREIVLSAGELEPQQVLWRQSR
ncbi:hypothetical protein [Lysobacter sp. N42]|uniref:hypothetical protein n=1 Tax=Lysobacter sp. N42 TaxID=2545719 RepID=UPI00104A549C|nr:hypothetical protein [Lysobacter sp. N42]TCZ78325.1 hypothetical protein EYQ95_25760 [Lysobacter sp. N42]